MPKVMLVAVALLAIMARDASADDKPVIFRGISCAVVRFYVTKYSAAAAEAWARSHGATDTDVEIARRCLIAEAVHTVSAFKHRQER